MNIIRLALRANSCGVSYPRASASTLAIGKSLSDSFTRAWKRRAATLCVCALGMAGPASALTVAWNPNPETDITSYVLSYGSSPGVYSQSVDVGNTTTASVTGLVEGESYYFMVTAKNQSGLQSVPSAEIFYQVPLTPPPAAGVLPRNGWVVSYVDSQETVGEDAAAGNAIDGDPNTIWHTQYLNREPRPPHEIQLDLGAECTLQGFRYLPRQDGWVNGNIAQYEFYVSMDGTNWGSAAATGTWANTAAEKEVLFSARNARYVKLRALSEVNGEAWACIAELNLLGAVATPVGTATTFSVWSAAAGLGTLEAAPLACPYQDGVPNLLKYAFALDGGRPDMRVMTPGTGMEGLPFIRVETQGTSVWLRFEYLRRINGGLTYTPRISHDMATWQPLSAVEQVTNVGSGFERVEIAEPCDPSAPAFGRVDVEMATAL